MAFGDLEVFILGALNYGQGLKFARKLSKLLSNHDGPNGIFEECLKMKLGSFCVPLKTKKPYEKNYKNFVPVTRTALSDCFPYGYTNLSRC